MAGGAITAFALLVGLLVGFWLTYHRRNQAARRRDSSATKRDVDGYTDSAPDADGGSSSGNGGD